MANKRFCLYYLLLTLLISLQGCKAENHSVLQPIEQIVSSPNLNKPADITRFQGYYVATELLNNRLVFFKDLDLSTARFFDPASIGKRFYSPHFLANSADKQLFISNGWGKSIVSITSLDGKNWEEFTGDEKGFNAPHGICVDDAGWIYVGDSLNSRLVRFRDMKGQDWEVFADHEKRISYARQLVCRDGAVWVSNSYESRPGLNPGRGSNVLKITDFPSGKAEILYQTEDTNITGILPVGDKLIVGRWREKHYVVYDMENGTPEKAAEVGGNLGIPYGLFLDNQNSQVIGAYFGDFKANAGGLVRLFSIN